MRCVIFANGWLSQPPNIDAGDLIIAADGGSRHCLELGLTPDYVVGDMDSLEQKDLSQLRNGGARFIEYPARKDYTDLELALQLAQRLGMEKVLVVAALGERWDQTIANLLLPVIYPGLQISFVDGQQEVFLLRSKNQMTVRGSPGDTVSLIPISGDAKGITTSGLEYTLSHETLFFGSTRGISNVLLSDNASIMLEEGLLLCVVIHIS